jgi:hypothetical protein
MKNLCSPEIAKWRDHEADRMYGTKDEERALGGAFLIMRIAPGYLSRRIALRVLASNDDGWDHISVSLSDRTPSWDEMEFVKNLFFERDEVAMQLHVPATDHVNNHPFCLHLWRPHDQPIPRPPADLVGIPGLGPEQIRMVLGR